MATSGKKKFSSSASLVFLLSLISISATYAQYVAPTPTFEVLEKGGFRAFIPALDKTYRFRINANINEEIGRGKPGKISGETTTKTNGVLALQFENRLNVGDTIKYRIHVDHAGAGYRKENLSYTVEKGDLKEEYSALGPTCKPSVTTVNGKTSCIGFPILLEEFNRPTLDTNRWTVEHMIPTYEGTNFEFNSYENINSTRFIRKGVLYLKPNPLKSDNEIRGILDLRGGCTASNLRQCYYRHVGAYYLPPVKSARITSKISFKYGKVDIRAKLPAGDWLFPIVELQMKDKIRGSSSPIVRIAYSRGNDRLTDLHGGNDIGSRLLSAGPVINHTEPERSFRLKLRASSDETPYNNDFHIYTLEWIPGRMSFYFDQNLYGEVSTAEGFEEFQSISSVPEAPYDREYVISLGVGVGGINDFPDKYISGNSPKPWTNYEPKYVKAFFDARNEWSATWNGDNSALQVDYVKVTAV